MYPLLHSSQWTPVGPNRAMYKNPRFDEVHSTNEIFTHTRREIEHFFTIYKELEGRVTATLGWGGPEDAQQVIADGRRNYLRAKEVHA